MNKIEFRELKTVINKRDEKEKQIDYLTDFLRTKYKGSDSIPKVEQELICLRREIDLMNWIIKDDNLPF